MKKSILFAAVASIAAPVSVSAQQFTFDGDVSVGVWANEDGGNGVQSNGGIDGRDTRSIGDLRFSVSREFNNGFSGQIDLNYLTLGSASGGLDNDDTTKETLDIALRGYRDFGGITGGIFLGYGGHDDNGDANRAMGYRFFGLEIIKDVSFGNIYGQIGYLDSHDQYDEGTQDAPFVQIGANYEMPKNYVLSGAIGYAGGEKYGSPGGYANRIMNAQIGIERQLDSKPITLYANYEVSQISYNVSGIQYGDTFQTLNVGVKFQMGKSAKRKPRLPSFGKWVAYNANEIE